MNLKFCIFLLLVSCAFSGTLGGTDGNKGNKKDKEENKKEKIVGDTDENDHEASFCIMDDNDNEANKKETESTNKMLQLEQNTENLPNDIQEIQKQNLEEKDANLQSGQKIDAQSILKKFKIQETFDKTWRDWNAEKMKGELDAAENSLRFKFEAGSYVFPCGPIRTVLWERENFPLSLFHQGNTYKLKSCDALKFFRPALHENQITIVYGNESPCWHATFPKYLKSFVFSDSDTISLVLTQEQPAEKPKATPTVGKLLLNTLAREETAKKEIEINRNPIYISVMHNNVEISDQLQNLLENSTKLDFENLKKLWEDIDTTNLAKIVAREKKRAMIVSVGVASVLGVSLFSFLYKIVSNKFAWMVERGLRSYGDALVDYYFDLGLFSILVILLSWLLGDFLYAKLRAKTLQKSTKY